MRELAPYLAEDGYDLDNLQTDNLEEFQQALNRAIDRRNAALFSPVGEAREVVIATLRLVVSAIAKGHSDLAKALLETIQPESPDNKTATVAGFIGVSLELLDHWFVDATSSAPSALAREVVLPHVAWADAAAARDVLALAKKGRAMSSLRSLIVHQGSHSLVSGAAVAVTGAVATWSLLAKTDFDDTVVARIR